MKTYGFFKDKFCSIDKPTEQILLDKKMDYSKTNARLTTNEQAIGEVNTLIDLYSYVTSSIYEENSDRAVEMSNYLISNNIKEIPPMFEHYMIGVIYELYDSTGKMIANGEHMSQAEAQTPILAKDVNIGDELKYNNMLLFTSCIQIDTPKTSGYDISKNLICPNTISNDYTIRIKKIKVYNTTRDGNIATDVYLTQPNLMGSFNNGCYRTYNSASNDCLEFENRRFITNAGTQNAYINSMIVPVVMQTPPVEEDIVIVETVDGFDFTNRVDRRTSAISITVQFLVDTLVEVYDEKKIDKIIDINNGKPFIESIETFMIPDQIYVEKGNRYEIKTFVDGYNLNDHTDVRYALEGIYDSGTAIDEYGNLIISLSEKSDKIVVHTTSLFDPTFTYKMDKVIGKPIAEHITIEPQGVAIDRGRHSQFTIKTEREMLVDLFLSGNNSIDTRVDETATVFIAEDETSDMVTLIAISKNTNLQRSETHMSGSIIPKQISPHVAVNIQDNTVTGYTTINVTSTPVAGPTIVIIPQVADVTVGGTFRFNIQVIDPPEEGYNLLLFVTGNTSNETVINKDGTLTIGDDETALKLNITATLEGLEVSAQVTANVIYEPSLAIDPTSASVTPGDTARFTVTGINIPEGSNVDLSITGNTSADTEVVSEAGGVAAVTIATDETSRLVVLNAALENTAISVDANINITYPPAVTISPKTVDVRVGDDIEFIITATSISSASVATISITGQTSANTIIVDDRTVRIASDETAENITVTVTVSPENITDTATITVIPLPTVSIEPETATMIAGTSQDFTITVSNPPETYTVDNIVIGAASTSTVVTSEGRVTIGLDETVSNITLRSEITGTDYFNTAAISIIYPSIEIEPMDPVLELDSSNVFTFTTENIPEGGIITKTITGQLSSSTVFDTTTDTLTIAADETATTIRVIAELEGTPVSTTSTVTVNQPFPRVEMTPATATVRMGETQQFTITVANPPISYRLINTIEETVASGTTFDEDGLLTVAADETATELTLTSTIEGTEYKKSSIVTVIPQPSIVVTPDITDVIAANTYDFTVDVMYPPETYTVVATLEGNTSADTTLSTTGELVVAEEETATSLTMTFTLEGTSVTASKVVNVLYSSITMEPDTVDVLVNSTTPFTITGMNIPQGKTITTTITGNLDIATVLNDDDELIVAASETSTEITVNALLLGTSILETSTVTVLQPSVEISLDTPSVLIGDTYNMTVVETNIPDTATVTISVAGNTSLDTIITDTGVLTIDADETATELVVTMRAVISTREVVDTFNVTLLYPSIEVTTDPASFDINSSAVTNVVKTNIPDENVIVYAMTGNTDAGTTIDENTGAITIDLNETATEVLVIASTDVNGINVSGNVTVPINHPSIAVTPESASLLIGGEATFTVDELHIPDTAVTTTELTGNLSANTTLNGTTVTIGTDETAEEITLTVSTMIETLELRDTALIRVLKSTIELSTDIANPLIGDTVNVTVTETNIPDENVVVLSLSDNLSENTTITQEGELFIALDETSETVSVHAVTSINGVDITDVINIPVTIPTLTIDPTTATVVKTRTQQFTVDTTNVPSDIIPTLTLIGNISADTTLSAEGLLTVAADETATELTVTTEITEFALTASAIVTVIDFPTISITPETAELNPGNTQQFTANVTSITGYTVTYGITGQTSAGTNITDEGLLTIGADEVDASVIVTASVEEYSISDTATVTVIDLPDPTISISPTTANVSKSQSMQFVVTLGHTEEGVTATVEVTGQTSAGTTVDNTGLLTVAADETATELTLTAKVESLSISDTATVTVLDLPTATMTPDTATVVKGETQQFTTEVTGPASYTVTYSVTDNVSIDTTIDSDGLLTVAADETAAELIVTATVTGYPVDDMATVTVTDPTPPPTPFIDIDPKTVTVALGGSQVFTVTAENLPEGETAIVSLAGNLSVDTTYDTTTNTLTVAADETATELTIEVSATDLTPVQAVVTIG